MPHTFVRTVRLATLLGMASLVAACAETQLRDQPDFGNAVHQDRAAQIADPDAHYAGTPAPASNGTRTDLAQDRYEHHRVLEPTATSTSNVAGAGGGGGGGGGGGSGGGMAGASGAP